MNVVSRTVVTLIAAFCGACSNKPHLSWTEDVLLPDGRVLTLKRYQEFLGPHGLGEPPTESDYWFEFSHPDTGDKIRWQSERTLMPVALIIEGITAELLVRTAFNGLELHKCPDPPYFFYRYADRKWSKVALASIRGRVFTPNLTMIATDAKSAIIASNYHLTTEQTAKTVAAPARGKKISFEGFKEQTFGTRCNSPFNWMLVN